MLDGTKLKSILADLADVDKQAEALVTLNTEATELIGKYEQSVNDVRERDTTITQLRDANSRLALKVTDTALNNNEGENDEPETAEEAMKWLTDKIGGNTDGN